MQDLLLLAALAAICVFIGVLMRKLDSFLETAYPSLPAADGEQQADDSNPPEEDTSASQTERA